MRIFSFFVAVLFALSVSAETAANRTTYTNIVDVVVMQNPDLNDHFFMEGFSSEDMDKYVEHGLEAHAAVLAYYAKENKALCNNKSYYLRNPEAFGVWWDDTELGFRALLDVIMPEFREKIGKSAADKLAEIEKHVKGDAVPYQRGFDVEKLDLQKVLSNICGDG